MFRAACQRLRGRRSLLERRGMGLHVPGSRSPVAVQSLAGRRTGSQIERSANGRIGGRLFRPPVGGRGRRRRRSHPGLRSLASVNVTAWESVWMIFEDSNGEPVAVTKDEGHHSLSCLTAIDSTLSGRTPPKGSLWQRHRSNLGLLWVRGGNLGAAPGRCRPPRTRDCTDTPGDSISTRGGGHVNRPAIRRRRNCPDGCTGRREHPRNLAGPRF